MSSLKQFENKLENIVSVLNTSSVWADIWHAWYPPDMYTDYYHNPNMDLNKIRSVFSKKINDFILYVNVPFCNQKCNYCWYWGKYNINRVWSRNYINLLIEEIKTFNSDNKKKKRIDWIYIGWWTPSLIDWKDWIYFFKYLRKNFTLKKDIEISIEATPNSITQEMTDDFKICWITRVQLWVQTFNEEILQKIWRNQTNKDVYNAVKFIRNSWIEEIAFDLIFWFDNESPESFLEHNLQNLINNSPDSTQLYFLQRYNSYKDYMINDENYKKIISQVRKFAPYKLSKYSLLRWWYMKNLLSVWTAWVSHIYDNNKLYILKNKAELNVFLENWVYNYRLNNFSSKDSIIKLIIRNLFYWTLHIKTLYERFPSYKKTIDNILKKIESFTIKKWEFLSIKPWFDKNLPFSRYNTYVNYFIFCYIYLYSKKLKTRLLNLN